MLVSVLDPVKSQAWIAQQGAAGTAEAAAAAGHGLSQVAPPPDVAAALAASYKALHGMIRLHASGTGSGQWSHAQDLWRAALQQFNVAGEAAAVSMGASAVACAVVMFCTDIGGSASNTQHSDHRIGWS